LPYALALLVPGPGATWLLIAVVFTTFTFALFAFAFYRTGHTVIAALPIKELKIPPNDPIGQRAYDAIAKAAEGESVSFTYDFPKPGTKASAPKETLEVRVGKQACGVSYFKA
jgi:hypothetical protein